MFDWVVLVFEEIKLRLTNTFTKFNYLIFIVIALYEIEVVRNIKFIKIHTKEDIYPL